MKTIHPFRDLTRRLAAAAALAAALGSLFFTSCHTVQGVGQDVQHVGEEIEEHTHHGH